VRIALGQFNATVGDLAGNVAKMKKIWSDAMASGADLVAFPEMAICGYPPEDLVYKEQFVRDNRTALEDLARACNRGTVVVGFVSEKGRSGLYSSTKSRRSISLKNGNDETLDARPGFEGEKSKREVFPPQSRPDLPFSDPGEASGLYNAAAVIQKGRIVHTYHKCSLPNYSVFDEQRYFQAGDRPVVVTVQGLRVAVTICEDLWHPQRLTDLLLGVGRIHLLLNISASPFDVDKLALRNEVIAKCSDAFDCAVAYCNLIGGQDELVFDGRSTVVDSTGRIAARARAFDEDLLIADVREDANGIQVEEQKVRRVEGEKVGESVTSGRRPGTDQTVRPSGLPSFSPSSSESADTVEEVYQALVLGLRDYVLKNGFKQVILGISGGIDSAVTAAIAVEALGSENVQCVTMPSRFNSPETIADSKLVADNLGCPLLAIPIEPILAQFHASLKADPRWTDQGIAYENLQARIRGMILMSLSNQVGSLVLTTGNKSEVSVGYSTLYGDSAGGFGVIKDVLKTMVYQLAEYINKRAGREVIPVAVIRRIPSAELRPNQKDTDSLPDYDVLDRIITGYVEEDKSARELVKAGLPAETVERVIRMIDRNEYKRRQSAPGVRITPKAFGKDRRLPITNRYTSTDAR
jgi:NAD+ synthase (glutamine-hydrolysing)